MLSGTKLFRSGRINLGSYNGPIHQAWCKIIETILKDVPVMVETHIAYDLETKQVDVETHVEDLEKATFTVLEDEDFGFLRS